MCRARWPIGAQILKGDDLAWAPPSPVVVVRECVTRFLNQLRTCLREYRSRVNRPARKDCAKLQALDTRWFNLTPSGCAEGGLVCSALYYINLCIYLRFGASTRGFELRTSGR